MSPPCTRHRRRSPRLQNATAELYDQADADRLAFWANKQLTELWDTHRGAGLVPALVAKWFVGGKLNVALKQPRTVIA